MTAADGASAKRRALEEEQAHLLTVHSRVDALRRAATVRAEEAAADHSGSTFQARFERDVVAHHHASRAARFTFGDVESLVFGRIDLDDAERLHVGRVSVVDDEQDVLLVDWRAPAAAAFYQATQATPLGVARRRTLVTSGPRLDDLDDELLDGEAADRLGLTAVTGQGALLAALGRHRTGHMRDIVATIQGDQDRIIRLPARGTVIVTGGPGTGKTVVALHRVAYLLYTHRDRFEGRGVLVVGPSDAFTEYISRVLPSLGEDRAVLRPLARFAPPNVRIDGWDDPETAAVKGDLRMVPILRALIPAVLPGLPPETRFSFDNIPVSASPTELRRARDRVLRRVVEGRAAYHDLREDAQRAMIGALWKTWRRAAKDQRARLPEDPVTSGFNRTVVDAPQVRLAWRSFWPALDASELLRTVVTSRVELRALASDHLEAAEISRLEKAWAPGRPWTVDDVAILDELRAIIGPVPVAPPDEAEADVGLRLAIGSPPPPVATIDVDDLYYDEFAHVVVDEAQDLTPMQWRMLARRGSYASWTVVGDLAQRSRVAEPKTWTDVAALIGRRQVEVERLTVNYRTPVEVVALARAVLEAAGHDPDEAPTSIRETGERPRLIRTERVREVAVSSALACLRAQAGTAVIVAPLPLVQHVRQELAARLEVAGDRLDLEGRVSVLDPRTVKGLEFDDVVVAGPDLIVASDAVGMHQLYVAVTRATRTLTIVAAPGAPVPGEAHLETLHD